MWTAADIDIELLDDISEHSVVSVSIKTSLGRLVVMGQVEQFDRELVLAGVHIHGETAVPGEALQANSLGWWRLRQIARAVMEKLDVDLIVVKGAVRTSGAVRGRYPGAIRFSR